MCGRYSIGVTPQELEKYLEEVFHMDGIPNDIIVPRYNVAPGQPVIAIINDGRNNRIGHLRWGLIPAFVKDANSGLGIINAKSETLTEKPAFRSSFQNKRCILLADGFYEWKRDGKTKTPFRIVLKNQKLFPLAGLWSLSIRPDGTKVYTCAIITTQANAIVSEIHDRMPVILREKDVPDWLNPKNSNTEALEKLFHPFNADSMDKYPVASVVNHAANETPDCIVRIS